MALAHTLSTSFRSYGGIPHWRKLGRIPTAAQQLCEKLKASPRLIAHLTFFHDAAVEIVEGLRQWFPTLSFDTDAFLFGAATHGLGKVLHPNEITGPSDQQEQDGPGLLELHGISPELARFARTHGAWNREALPMEDLLVAFADCVWKGQRLEAFEAQVIAQTVEKIGGEQWDLFDKFDGLLDDVAARGAERLAWQQCGK